MEQFSNASLSKAERYCRRHSQNIPLYIFYDSDSDTYDVLESRYAAMPWQTLISSYYMGERVSQSFATIIRPAT